jgi:hypothetical protein
MPPATTRFKRFNFSKLGKPSVNEPAASLVISLSLAVRRLGFLSQSKILSHYFF